MRPLARWLAACGLLLIGSSAQAALHLQLKTEGLSPAEQQASQALLDEAMQRLPPRFIEQLDRQVLWGGPMTCPPTLTARLR